MDECDNSCEPMDIDLSTNSTNAMEISYGKISNDEKQRSSNIFSDDIQYKVIESVDNCKETKFFQNEKKLVNLKNNSDRTILLTAAVVFVLSVLTYNILAIKCYKDLNLTILNETLQNKLYGQTLAIENVLDFLNFRDEAKMIVLYGGTGVGKTYMVSLLFENVFNHTNVYYYSMSNLERTFSSESMFGVTLCDTSVVIIDDVSLKNKEIKNYVETLITRSTNLNKSITVILIYNCANVNHQFHSNCPDNYLIELKLLLNNDINVMKKFVRFESLTEDSLMKCIQYELKDNMLSKADFNKIMKNFNVEKDGCKGVHQKMKYLNIS